MTADAMQPSLSDADWRKLERLIAEFEAGLRRGETPTIDDVLSADDPDRSRFLVEFVQVEMEYRLKRGEAARVEEYLARHRELGGRDEVLVDLARTEAQIRSRFEPGFDPRSVEVRFPQLAGKLRGIELPRQGRSMAAINSPSVVGELLGRFDRDRSARLGKYELKQSVGEGAFGRVFRAWDTVLKREVAVKIPRPEVASSPMEIDAFLREARNTIKLRHDNIVEIHDAGPVDGVVCLVRRFVEGITLAERSRIGPIGLRETSRIMARVARGLAHAHRQGIIHRDLKPSNILLSRDGQCFLTDFALAKRSTGDSTISPEGIMPGSIGTPAYMSPEQARGDTTRVDPRSDIFAAGAILYEMLTGSLPFRGRGRMLLVNIEEASPTPPRQLNEEIPAELEAVCLKALARKPSNRYQDAEALAADLEDFAEGRPVAERPNSRTPSRSAVVAAPPRRPAARWPWLVSAASAAIAVVAVGIAARSERRRSVDVGLATSLARSWPIDGPCLAHEFWTRQGRPPGAPIPPAGPGWQDLWTSTMAKDPDLGPARLAILVRQAEFATAEGPRDMAITAWRRVVGACESGSIPPAPARMLDGPEQAEARARAELGRLAQDAGNFEECKAQRIEATRRFREIAERCRSRIASGDQDPDLRICFVEASIAICRLEPTGTGPASPIDRLREAEAVVGRVSGSPGLGADRASRLVELQLELAELASGDPAIGPEYRSRLIVQAASLLNLSEQGHDPTRLAMLLARVDRLNAINESREGRHWQAINQLRAGEQRLKSLGRRMVSTIAEADDLAALLVATDVDLARAGEAVRMPREARKSYRQAIDRQRKICWSHPDNPLDRARLAELRVALGRVERQLGKGLRSRFQVALAVVDDAWTIGLAPGSPEHPRRMVEHLRSLP